MRILLKILVILIIITALYFFKKKKEKENYKKFQRMMAIKSRADNKERLLMESQKKDIIVSKENKQNQLQLLYSSIDLVVNKEDAEKLKNTIKEKVKKEQQFKNWSIINEFLSKEVSNLEFNHNINFRSNFDWKFESFYLRDYIVKTMKSNFSLDFEADKICDLSKNKFIHEAFPKYEMELDKLGIKLRNIDINSDSYHIVLVNKVNEKKLEDLVNQMGFKLMSVN